jgi:hypothetical protein
MPTEGKQGVTAAFLIAHELADPCCFREVLLYTSQIRKSEDRVPYPFLRQRFLIWALSMYRAALDYDD